MREHLENHSLLSLLRGDGGLFNNREAHAICLRERYERLLASAEYKHIRLTSRKGMSGSVFYCDDVERPLF